MKLEHGVYIVDGFDRLFKIIEIDKLIGEYESRGKRYDRPDLFIGECLTAELPYNSKWFPDGVVHTGPGAVNIKKDIRRVVNKDDDTEYFLWF